MALFFYAKNSACKFDNFIYSKLLLNSTFHISTFLFKTNLANFHQSNFDINFLTKIWQINARFSTCKIIQISQNFLNQISWKQKIKTHDYSCVFYLSLSLSSLFFLLTLMALSCLISSAIFLLTFAGISSLNISPSPTFSQILTTEFKNSISTFA